LEVQKEDRHSVAELWTRIGMVLLVDLPLHSTACRKSYKT